MNISIEEILQKYGQKNTFYTKQAIKEIVEAVVDNCYLEASRHINGHMINGRQNTIFKTGREIKQSILKVKTRIDYGTN